MNKKYWPRDLKLVERRGGITTSELWILQEQLESGVLKKVDGPEKAFGQTSHFYTIFGTKNKNSQVYVIMTEGNPTDGPNWCWIKAVNKLSEKQATIILSDSYWYDE